MVLLENISEFKLRYIGKEKEDWVSTWQTDEGGDTATKGKFPTAVEISMTIKRETGKKKKEYSMQVVSQIRFPNNEEAKNANSSGGLHRRAACLCIDRVRATLPPPKRKGDPC